MARSRDLARNLARKIVGRYRDEYRVGKNIFYRDKQNQERVTFLDISFTFDIKGKNLDILIEPKKEDKEDFKLHILDIQTKEFWHDPSRKTLDENREMYGRCFRNSKFELNGNGNYHFKAYLQTDNFEKIICGIIYQAINPAMLFTKRRPSSMSPTEQEKLNTK